LTRAGASYFGCATHRARHFSTLPYPMSTLSLTSTVRGHG
jgi:hypothetical protein